MPAKKFHLSAEKKWSVYENNVQTYRSNMLESQSILLAVGAILINENTLIFIALAFISIFQSWFIWFRLIYSRLKIVDFYKFNIGERTKIKEKEYVQNRNLRKKINKKLKIGPTLRYTRVKLDIMIPATMNFLWLLIGCIKFI